MPLEFVAPRARGNDDTPEIARTPLAFRRRVCYGAPCTRVTELLTELKALHPRRMDLSLGRIDALLAKLGNPQDRLPACHSYCRHQRQGLDRGAAEGHAAGRRQARPRLHVAAPRALPRAHRARRRGWQGTADRRGRARRAAWSAPGASTTADPSRSSRLRRRRRSRPSPSIRPMPSFWRWGSAADSTPPTWSLARH